MLPAVLSGLLVSIIFAVAGKQLKGTSPWFMPLLPAALFTYFLSLSPQISGDNYLLFSYTWVDSMGVNLNFRLDSLSLLFSLLITGIGTLVMLYSISYMKDHNQLDRFYGYLSLFMSSMLGLVLSDNLITLFIFWELTSISSFFLIGFNYTDKGARKAALLALCITGGGGLLLLAGFLLMAGIAGSYEISEIISNAELLTGNEYYGALLLLIFAGAFTKSAQFPFHFWLPDAMKAPTPVSTYLHSATMVKAGVYLLARFSPALEGPGLWHNSLLIFGGITMLYGAFHALWRTDLKAILAYTTISALGLMVFSIGLGSPVAFGAFGLFVVVHALYKSSMFLIAGIIDHNTGTRDLRLLGGLKKSMPIVFFAAILAALSNAGMLPLLGYHSKHLIYESTLSFAGFEVLLTAAVLITNVMLVAAGFLVCFRPFLGKGNQNTDRNTGGKGIATWLWITALAPGILALLAGAFPGLADRFIVGQISSLLSGTAVENHLHLFTGIDLIFVLSIATIFPGLVLYFLVKPGSNKIDDLLKKAEFFSPGKLMLGLARSTAGFFGLATHTFQSGYLRYYTGIIMGFLVIVMGLKMFQGYEWQLVAPSFSDFTFIEVVNILVLISALLMAIISGSRLLAVASLGVVGLCICLVFLFYSAPDLAMTQFTIDTLTVVLFILLLRGLPAYLTKTDLGVNWRDLFLAIAFGGIIFLHALEIMAHDTDNTINAFYAENAYQLAKGKNVVNVILVDFRGTDTLLEIIVLAVAGLGVFSLIKLKVSDPPG